MLAPVSLTIVAKILIHGDPAGWRTVTPGSLVFIQQPVFADENGAPVNATEAWIYFTDQTSSEIVGVPWHSVDAGILSQLPVSM